MTHKLDLIFGALQISFPCRPQFGHLSSGSDPLNHSLLPLIALHAFELHFDEF